MKIKILMGLFLLLCSIVCAKESKAALYLVEENESLTAAVHLSIPEGYHAYWKNPGGVGFAPSIEWTLPETISASEPLWPYPEKFLTHDGVSYGYSEDVWIFVPLQKNGPFKENIQAHVRWLICSEKECLPKEADLEAQNITSNKSLMEQYHANRKKLPSSPVFPFVSSANGLLMHTSSEGVKDVYFAPFEGDGEIEAFRIQKEGIWVPAKDSASGVVVIEDHQGKRAFEYFPEKNLVAMNVHGAVSHLTLIDQEGFYLSLLLSIGGAFLGGLLLNLMPCVLPVITLKIFSFVKMAGHDRRVILRHSLLFTLGVVLSFWLLASLLLLLKAYGQSVGWGFQLQEPLFVAGLITVLVIFSFSLFGLFEFGASIASWAGNKETGNRENKGSSSFGAFLSGVLATVVATPCTGPFLGAALGLALTLPPLFSLAIFTALGLGLSSPYLLVALFPSFLKWLPKPGNWMVTFKEIVGFCMLATVFWLLWVFGSLTNHQALFTLLAGLFVVVVSCYVFGKWTLPHKKKWIRRMGWVVATILLCSGFYLVIEASVADVSNEKGEAFIGWESFDPVRLKELQEKNVPVFVDFTAKWCLICQANHATLSSHEVEKAFKNKGVVKMEADWTRKNPIITKALEEHGRNSVPLYLLYNGEEKPHIFSQILTSDSLIAEVEKIHD